MWKVLNKEVDVGEPTSFLDHVYLGCTQRQCEISKDIVDNYRTMFESRISAGVAGKITIPSKSSYFFMVWNTVGKVPNWECLLVNREKGRFLCVGGRYKTGWENAEHSHLSQHRKEMWTLVNKKGDARKLRTEWQRTSIGVWDVEEAARLWRFKEMWRMKMSAWRLQTQAGKMWQITFGRPRHGEKGGP